uniref:Binding protein n=1 Tax=Solanum tuberosum TaxID=4113 RepID=M1AVC5_SOLTU
MSSSPDEGVYPNYDAPEGQIDLFNRLCPLLVVRLLPLQVFNDLNSSALYDELPTKLAHGTLCCF